LGQEMVQEMVRAQGMVGVGVGVGVVLVGWD